MLASKAMPLRRMDAFFSNYKAIIKHQRGTSNGESLLPTAKLLTTTGCRGGREKTDKLRQRAQ